MDPISPASARTDEGQLRPAAPAPNEAPAGERAGEPPPFQELLRSSDAKQDLCVLAVLTWIAACDGKIDPREQELLQRVAEGGVAAGGAGGDGSAGLPAVLETARLCRPKDLEAACRFLRNNSSRGDRCLLARLAVTMAVQDEDLSIGENLVLQFLANLLGIRPRAFARLFEEIARRPFPVPGDPGDPDWWRLREAGGQGEAGPEAWDRLGRKRRGLRRLAGAAGATIGRAGATVGRAGASFGRAAWGAAGGRGFRAAPAFEGAGGFDGGPPGLEEGDEDEPMTRAEALRLFGLADGAPPRKVHAAYRRLAKARHPDRFAPLGPSAVATATFAFQRINDAYAMLKHE